MLKWSFRGERVACAHDYKRPQQIQVLLAIALLQMKIPQIAGAYRSEVPLTKDGILKANGLPYQLSIDKVTIYIIEYY